MTFVETWPLHGQYPRKKGGQNRHGSQGVRLATASHGHKGAAKKALANILGSEAEKMGLSRVPLLRS